MIESTNMPVVFELLSCSDGKHIGVVTLNVEKTLNSLTLEMVELMLKQFELWRHDESIACLFIKGAGSKAFCAGGDVQALYQSATQSPGGPCEYAETFFEKEYCLDHLLHVYPKPVVCWGHGIVMGGGLGVFAACSHRIVTEKTRLAMPEVTIGLYPDVGGSWFLNKMPDNVGTFLALTGAPINAKDCLFVDIADYYLDSQLQETVLTALSEQAWSSVSEENNLTVDKLLKELSLTCADNIPDGNIESHLSIINSLCDANDVCQIVNNIANLTLDDKWLVRAQKTLLAGSPLSVHIIYQQLQRARQLSLADVFRSELILSINIVRRPEFSEGVRALLIDKDNTPKWQFTEMEKVPAEEVANHFIAPKLPAPWPSNPLENL